MCTCRRLPIVYVEACNILQPCLDDCNKPCERKIEKVSPKISHSCVSLHIWHIKQKCYSIIRLRLGAAFVTLLARPGEQEETCSSSLRRQRACEEIQDEGKDGKVHKRQRREEIESEHDEEHEEPEEEEEGACESNESFDHLQDIWKQLVLPTICCWVIWVQRHH